MFPRLLPRPHRPGLVPFSELFDRVNRGETFGVYTHDATNTDTPAQRVEITTPEAFMITGYNDIVRLRFENGMELRCTPGHKIFTTNRGYVEAGELTAEDEVKVLDLPAPAVNAERPAGVFDIRRLPPQRLTMATVALPREVDPGVRPLPRLARR